MRQESAHATPFTDTAVGRRFWDVAEKVAPMLTLLALRACKFSQACQMSYCECCGAVSYSRPLHASQKRCTSDCCARPDGVRTHLPAFYRQSGPQEWLHAILRYVEEKD